LLLLAAFSVLMLVLLVFAALAALAAGWPVHDGVPPGVTCTVVEECWNFTGAFENVCARVCAPGSVVQPAWITEAIALQLRLSHSQPVCMQQWPASHNSAITLADGYGVLDGVLTRLAGSLVRTSNQWLSLTDQLDMGVRFLELDSHWVLGELRIAHCGGVKVGFVDAFVALLDDAARAMGLPPIPWDSGDIGCWPSGSSIPANKQRSLASAYAEVAAWLRRNPEQFVMLYHDDQEDMHTFGKVRYLLREASAAFGSLIFTPGDWNETASVAQLIARGKRVMLHSRTNYGAAAMGRLFYATASICNWTEPDLKDIDTVNCTVNGKPTMAGRIYRPETDWLMYGPFDGEDPRRLNVTTLPPVVACGVNLPSPDAIVPAILAAQVWSLAEGVTLAGAACAVMRPGSPRWLPLADPAACAALPRVRITNALENMRVYRALSSPVNVLQLV
jgi:hypothetical protein